MGILLSSGSQEITTWILVMRTENQNEADRLKTSFLHSQLISSIHPDPGAVLGTMKTKCLPIWSSNYYVIFQCKMDGGSQGEEK